MQRPTFTSLDDDEAERIGAALSKEPLLKRDHEHRDRWQTLSGDYTNKGLARRIMRFIDELRNPPAP